jgi:hypothetical protein
MNAHKFQCMVSGRRLRRVLDLFGRAFVSRVNRCIHAHGKVRTFDIARVDIIGTAGEPR